MPVKINQDPHTYYALLDSGSTNSFISETVASHLNLRSDRIRYNISTISDQSCVDKVVSFRLSSPEGGDAVQLANVLVIPDIPARHPSKEINLINYPHLADLPLTNEGKFVKADILIGMDNGHLMVPYDVRCNLEGNNEPYATRTYFGWALSGPVAGSSRCVYSHFVQTGIGQQIENLWHIESGDADSRATSPDDQKVLDLWDRETVFEGGHFTIPIPWKHDKVCLPNNKMVALHRLHGLRKRLEKSGTMATYDENVNKFLDRGFAEKVPDDQLRLDDGSVWYLPHHGVTNEAKGGKLRVVMDCASKLNGISLNNQCLQGPDLTNKLIDVLLRFRQFQYAVTADVECMYMQVKIPEKDRNALRFFWYDAKGNLTQYRMTSHLFGGIWCSSSSTYALRKTCQEVAVSESVRDAISRSFYVDDLLRSMTTAIEAKEIIHGTRDVLKSGGFNLTKFVVNDKSLMKEIDPQDRAVEVKEITPEIISKALGIRWDVNSDCFYYVNRPVADSTHVTRRIILSQVSSMYDPMGLITPIVIRGRMIFQEVTRLRILWDDVVPSTLANKCFLWLASLDTLSSMTFCRCLIPDSFVDGVAELVHFCDASLSGYGACSYVRIVNKSADVRVILIMSKGRVAPLKQISIPRLELCAAVLAVRLDVLLRRELDITFMQSTYFTDSEIVRAYIHNDTKRYKVFVANRVSEIRQRSEPDQWRHIDGKSNPADILSRGCDVSDVPECWYRGPGFLHQFKCDWPGNVAPPNLDGDPEVISSNIPGCSHAYDVETPVHPLDKLIHHYQSFYRLKKAISWLMRLKRFLRHKHIIDGPIVVPELTDAERLLIMHAQAQAYSEELSRLHQCKSVAKSSSVAKLDPMLHDGIMVIGGRLRHSQLPFQARHPVILPCKHKLSRMIVLDYHGDAHLGVEWTLSRVRQKYWIVKARNMIKSVKRACVVCHKLYAPPVQQKMADLPPERCEAYRPPFSFTGLDIFGPFYVKQGRSEVKRYGVVFTCFTTRAIHIEKLSSLETDAFLNAFIRFVARRGCPIKVWSDNATTFVGANNELIKGQRQLNRSRIVQTARRLDVEWIYNPPYASHHGGVWERLIRTIRKVLCAVLHKNARLTDDTLHTFLCEVENIINGRPITKYSDDVNDDSPLTPNHLLILGSNRSFPCGVFSDSDVYRKQWRHVQHMVNVFWKRWIAEYLPILQSRRKWLRILENVKVGDLVLIVDESVPRGSWPMGLVTDVTEGRDGLVRSVKMRSRNKQVVRPITKIVFLEGLGQQE